jgi:hypothetical protein
MPEGSYYPPVMYWSVRYSTDSGQKSFTAAPEQKTFTVTLPKNIPAAVLVWPVTVHPAGTVRFFHPAGCIYPYTTVLAWQDGFAADILATLYSASKDRETTGSFCSYFNWERFMDVLHRKETESEDCIRQAIEDGTSTIPAYYNPWLLDKNDILSAIADRSFTVYRLYPCPRITVATAAIAVFPSMSGTCTASDLLSPYIPENNLIRESSCITISSVSGMQTLFLYNTDALLSFSLSPAGKITLAISALPLYTGAK